MHRFLTPSDRWVKPAWVLPLALLALPNCDFHPSPFPQLSIPSGTTLVLCDINLEIPERHCSTAHELDVSVRLTDAAVGLVQGERGVRYGIDDSPAALARCAGQPETILFSGEYPYGDQFCVDPAVVGPGNQFATTTDVCVEVCLELIGESNPPSPVDLDFCQHRAQASTNVPADPNVSFGGACSPAGNPLRTFADPRFVGEPTTWTNATGVDTTGGNIVRTAPCTTSPCSGFDAGAAGVETVTHGDGYLEFSVNETTTNRIGGLTSGLGQDDTSVDFTTLGFGIDFFRDGCFYVFENGVRRPAAAPLSGCVVPSDAFGLYASGDRFRITFKDNFDGTTTISYAKLPGPCTPGSECPANTFFVSAVHGAYPLHVDAGFEDQGGALLDVRVVYIH
jgi:hypothetical protein